MLRAKAVAARNRFAEAALVPTVGQAGGFDQAVEGVVQRMGGLPMVKALLLRLRCGKDVPLAELCFEPVGVRPAQVDVSSRACSRLR